MKAIAFQIFGSQRSWHLFSLLFSFLLDSLIPGCGLWWILQQRLQHSLGRAGPGDSHLFKLFIGISMS